MKQIIGTEFEEYYYLLEDGTLYNSNTKHYLKEKQRCFRLKTKDGKQKKISLKKLYQLVYNRNFCVDKIENLPDEEWKEIEETDGLYYISNKGRVKSYAGYTAIILKPSVKTKAQQYERVQILIHGEQQQVAVHRLVAFSFLDTPKNIALYEVHHKDFDESNNDVNNLQWLTITEHRKLHAKLRKEKSADAKANSTELENNLGK